MSAAVISSSGLTKTFAARTVVDSLELLVPEGVVYGFLGPNGSGKTTTMKMLLGLTRPTSGEVRLFGETTTVAGRPDMVRKVGSMIEAPPGYGHLTGRENLEIVRDMLGLQKAAVEEALETVRLTEHQDRLVRTYSLGMKQRLGIAIALVRAPRLLVLDEPTNGLDPAGIEEMRHLLVDLARQGITIMVSSHLLDEIDKMADVLGILSHGRMIFQGTRSELFSRSTPDLVVETPAGGDALTTLGLEGTRTEAGIRLPGLDQAAGAEAIRRLAVAGVPIHQAYRVQQSLEDVFIDLTGRGGAL